MFHPIRKTKGRLRRLTASILTAVLVAGLLAEAVPVGLTQALAAPAADLEQSAEPSVTDQVYAQSSMSLSGADPSAQGEQADLTATPLVLQGTFTVSQDNPYIAWQLPFYNTGGGPALVEVELAVGAAAVGGLSLYNSHLKPSADAPGQWEVDDNTPSLRIPLSPAGGRYTAAGYVLPGQNQLNVSPMLRGGGFSDEGQEPFVTGDLPYTITIRPVGPLPAEGFTMDMGAYAVQMAFLKSSYMESSRRFTLSQAGLYRVAAPATAGHTEVSLRPVQGSSSDEGYGEAQYIDLAAGQKAPFYLTAGQWELRVVETQPGPSEEPLPTDPAAVLTPSVTLAPWTQADYAEDGGVELATSMAFGLKVPPELVGYRLISVQAPAYNADLSVGWTSRSFRAGAAETYVQSLNIGDTLSFRGSQADRAGYRIKLSPLTELGEKPVTLKGSVTVDDPESSAQPAGLTLNMPQPGWYPVQLTTSADRAALSWGSLQFPAHSTDQGGSAPAPLLPLGYGTPALNVYPGAGLRANWQLDVGKGQPYPGRTVTLQGQLLKDEVVQLPLQLGIRQETNVDLQVAMDGPDGSYAMLDWSCGNGYYASCWYQPVTGKDNSDTPTKDERVYSNPVEKLYGDGLVKLTRKDEVAGPLSYTITITLPEVREAVITKTDGTGSSKVEGAGPLEVPLGETLTLDARDLASGLDMNDRITGHSLNVAWSAASVNGTGGQATIDRWGRLTAQQVGEVTVTAAYTDEPGIAPATRVVRITGPVPPAVDASSGPDWANPGKWLLTGSANVQSPKSITKLEVRLDGAGNWVTLAAPVATGLGTPYAYFSSDPAVLFPGLAEGQHTLEVRATDSVGAVSTKSAVFWMDATPPVMTGVEARQSLDLSGAVIAAPGPLDVKRPISLAGIATDQAGQSAGALQGIDFEYRLKGSLAWKSLGRTWFDSDTGVQSPVSWPADNLPEADYEVRAVAVDTSGNRSQPYTTVYHLTGGAVDAEPPTELGLTLLSQDSGYYDQAYYMYAKDTATFQFQGRDQGIGLAYAQVEKRSSTATTAEGQPVWGPWSPIGSEVPYPGDFTTWQGSVDLSALSDGLYQFRIAASDSAGNVGYGEANGYPEGVVQAVIANAGPVDVSELTAAYLPPDLTNPAPRVELQWPAVRVVSRYEVERQIVPQGAQPAPNQWTYVGYALQAQTPVFSEVPQGLAQGSSVYYRVTVRDPFDRLSPEGKVVSLILQPDDSAPTLEAPLVGGKLSGSTVRGKVKIQLPFQDNQGVSRVTVTVAGAKGGSYGTLTASPAAAAGEAVLDWDTTGLQDGDYVLQMMAYDYWNNESHLFFYNVAVDNAPPEAPASAQAEAVKGKLQANVSWTAGTSPDTAGYQLYRIEGAAQSLIAKLPVETMAYSDSDGLMPLHRYRYAVRAVDKAGNVSIDAALSNEVLIGEDTEAPAVRIPVKRVTKKLMPRAGDSLPVAPVLLTDGNLSTDNVGITEFTWNPGDGFPTLSGRRTTHVYTKPGIYVSTLEARDAAGNSSTGTMIVEVLEAAKPSVLLTIKDAETGLNLSGVTVAVKSSAGTETLLADAEPLELYAAPGETVFLSLYKKGYLGASTQISIPLVGQTPKAVYLRQGELAVGQLQTKRLTLDEIKALGIDITKPENQRVKKIEIQIACKNGDKPCGEGGAGGGGGSGTGYVNGNNEPVMNSGKENVCKFQEWNPETNRYEEKEYGCFFKLFEPPEPGSSGGSGVALFRIDGEAKWLKEFFRVDAMIFNPSDTGFVIKNGRIALDAQGLGNGLALVGTPETEATAVARVPDLGGNTPSYTASWVLRGDKEGAYAIKALFTGTMEFGAGSQVPVRTELQAEKPLKVYGDKAIEMTVVAPAQLIEGEMAEVKVKLRNTTEDAPVYGLSLTMKEPHLLEQNEKATQTRDVLPPGETWETVWHIKAPGNSPDDLNGLWGDAGDEPLDPVPNPTHFLKGRVVYRPGEGKDEGVVGAIVKIDGRAVAKTGTDGFFEAGTDKTGTLAVTVAGGGWRGAWHTTASVSEHDRYVTVEKHPDAKTAGTGYLISSTLIISLKNSLENLKTNELHDPVKVMKVEQFALKVLDKGLNGGKESTGPYEEETLRRLFAVAAFIGQNDQFAGEFMDVAADSMWDGVVGPLTTVLESLNTGEILRTKLRELPFIQNRKTLDAVLEKGLADGLESQVQQVSEWTQQQILKRFKNMPQALAKDLGEDIANAMKGSLNEAQTQLTEKVNEMVSTHATTPLEDAAKTAFKNAMLKAYKDGSDKALGNALMYAELSISPDAQVRWWTPDTFSEVEKRMADLRVLSQDLNRKLSDKKAKLITLNTITEILEGVAERSEQVNQFVKQIDVLPHAQAVDKATTILAAISNVGKTVDQTLINGSEMTALSFNLIEMTSGSRGLLYINERAAFGAFSQTWVFNKPAEPDNQVSRLSAGSFFNFVLAPLFGDPAGKLKKGGMQVALRSPADLYIVDSQGRALGVDPATGREVAPDKRIPGGYYTGPGSEPELVIVPDPEAQLTFSMVGTGEGGPVTLEFTRLGTRSTAAGGEAPASKSLVLKDAVAPGQQVSFNVTVPDAGQAQNQAMPTIARNGVKLPSLTVGGNGPDGAVVAVQNQPLALSVQLADGSSVGEVVLRLPWNEELLGSEPELVAGSGWTVSTQAAVAGGYLTAVLKRDAAGAGAGNAAGDAAAELLQLRTTPVRTGETFLRLSAPDVKLYGPDHEPEGGGNSSGNGSGQPEVLGLGADVKVLITDGTLDATGIVSAFFGGLVGRDEATGAALSAKEARAKPLAQYSATQARVASGAAVKLWAVDGDGRRTGGEPAYQGASGADGRFRLADVLPGDYWLEVSLPGLLSRELKVTLALGDGQLGLVDLLPGDVNADGVIDLLDFVLLQTNLGDLSAVQDAALRQRLAWLDLNRDGQLSADEASQLRPFYRRTTVAP